MNSVQSLLLSEVLNCSLAETTLPLSQDIRTNELATKLLASDGALLRTPQKTSFFNKVILAIRNKFFKAELCTYWDVKRNLTLLDKALQQPEIHFNIATADAQRVLRTFYNGDGKAVLSQAAISLSQAISTLGISDAKKNTLRQLIGTITQRLNKGPILQEDFAHYNNQSKTIAHALAALSEKSPDLAQIRASLVRIKQAAIEKKEDISQLAIGEELRWAFAKLEEQENIQNLKTSLATATSIQQLFQTTADCIKKYSPNPQYKNELTDHFTHQACLALEEKIPGLLKAFEAKCFASMNRMDEALEHITTWQQELEAIFKDIMLPDTFDAAPLAKAAETYRKALESYEHIPRAYITLFKKLLAGEVDTIIEMVEHTPDLERIVHLKHATRTLQGVITLFENALQRNPNSKNAQEVADVLAGIKMQLDKVDDILAKRTLEQARAKQGEIQLGLENVQALMRQEEVEVELNGKHYKITPIQGPKSLELSALCVALSAAKWVPVVGEPVVATIEYTQNITPSLLESAGGSMLVTALLTAYVAHAGYSPISLGALWKTLPFLAPNMATSLVSHSPVVRLLPRPITLGLGMIAAAIPAYVWYRGITGTLWDAGSMAVTYGPGLAWSIIKTFK